EEDRLGRRLVRTDALGSALARDLEEPRDVAAASGDVAELQGDPIALLVLGEIDERESTARQELDDPVSTDALASFQLDHGEDSEVTMRVRSDPWDRGARRHLFERPRPGIESIPVAGVRSPEELSRPEQEGRESRSRRDSQNRKGSPREPAEGRP